MNNSTEGSGSTNQTKKNHNYINEARMTVGKTPTTQSIFFVEGDTDHHVISKFSSERCKIHDLDGKINVLEAYNQMRNDKHFSKYLFLIDQDYSSVVGTECTEDNLLETDYNDMECMLFFSEAFKKYISYKFRNNNKLFKGESVCHEKLLEISLRVHHILACARIVRLLKIDELKINDIAKTLSETVIQNFEEAESDFYLLAKDLFLDQINIRNKVIYNDKIKSDILLEFKNRRIEKINAHGHDLDDIVTSLMKFFGLNIKGKASDGVMAYYDSRFFKKTNLFKKIKNYEKKVGKEFLDAEI
jgi:hypothetical protein